LTIEIAITPPLFLALFNISQTLASDGIFKRDMARERNDKRCAGNSGGMIVLLETLTPAEAEVIRMRFGIGADGEHTREETSRRLSLAPETARQAEKAALRKLRHPLRIKELKALAVEEPSACGEYAKMKTLAESKGKDSRTQV
jgi:DNA-binding CsgD family transcriptional regulator